MYLDCEQLWLRITTPASKGTLFSFEFLSPGRTTASMRVMRHLSRGKLIPPPAHIKPVPIIWDGLKSRPAGFDASNSRLLVFCDHQTEEVVTLTICRPADV